MTADIEHYRDWEITLTEQHDASLPWRATAWRGVEGGREKIVAEGVNRDCALAMVVTKIDRTAR